MSVLVVVVSTRPMRPPASLQQAKHGDGNAGHGDRGADHPLQQSDLERGHVGSQRGDVRLGRRLMTLVGASVPGHPDDRFGEGFFGAGGAAGKLGRGGRQCLDGRVGVERHTASVPQGVVRRATGRRVPRTSGDRRGRPCGAEPGFAHEGPASRIAELFVRITDALADRGREVSWTPAGALRLVSDDGAFEADTSLYLDPAAERAVRQVEEYLDIGAGLPPPDLVVEIDRSRRSGYKLAPYFRMGVKEAWTSHRKDGVSIWTPDAGVAEGFRSVSTSAVLPGLTAADPP